MSKSKRSNYLIDKPFQLGFILRFILIIIITIAITIIISTTITFLYFWITSKIGPYKLNNAIDDIYQGQLTHNNKKNGYKVYSFDELSIQVYKDKEINKWIVYKTFQGTSDDIKQNDIIENIDESKLEDVIGMIRERKTKFDIIWCPLIITLSITGLILILIISIYSLFFSHRMAGPVYRIRVSLDRMISGDFDFKIRARKTDFFLNLIDRLEKLRQQILDKNN